MKKLPWLILLIAPLLCSYGSKAKPVEPSTANETPQSIKDYNAGVAAQEKKDYESAIQYYQSSLAQKSDFADAWNNLGFCYRQIAKSYLDKTDDAYKKALNINPSYENALEYQGEYFLMRGQLFEAYRNYQHLKALKSKEASDLKDALDPILKDAQKVLKVYSP